MARPLPKRSWLSYDTIREHGTKGCETTPTSHVGGVLLFLVLISTEERKAHTEGESDCKRQLGCKETDACKGQDAKSTCSIDCFTATPGILGLDLLVDVLR